MFFLFSFLMMGMRIQIAQKAGHHQLTSEMAFRWRVYDGPTLNLVFCDFSGDPD